MLVWHTPTELPNSGCLGRMRSSTALTVGARTYFTPSHAMKSLLHSLVDGVEWEKKTKANPTRGFQDDGPNIAAEQ